MEHYHPEPLHTSKEHDRLQQKIDEMTIELDSLKSQNQHL